MLGNRPEAADRTQTALNYKQLNIITKERKNFQGASITRQESHTQDGGPRQGELVGAIRDGQTSLDAQPGSARISQSRPYPRELSETTPTHDASAPHTDPQSSTRMTQRHPRV